MLRDKIDCVSDTLSIVCGERVVFSGWNIFKCRTFLLLIQRESILWTRKFKLDLCTDTVISLYRKNRRSLYRGYVPYIIL